MQHKQILKNRITETGLVNGGTVRSEHPKNKIYHCLKVSLKLKPINNQLKSVIIKGG